MLRDATAILLLSLCQAIDLRGGPNDLGAGNKAIFAKVRSEVSFMDNDRPLDEDIAAVSQLIRNQIIPLPE